MTRLRASHLKLLVLIASLAIPVFALGSDPRSGAERAGVKLPLGITPEIWSYFVPRASSVTPGRIELGRQLFFDKRLSADGNVSCASCHDPQLAFADGKPVAEGIGGRRGTRNSPSLFNAMFNSGQFWDGRAETLEAQAVLPLINPDEMGNDSLEKVVERLRSLPEYARQFQENFNGPVTVESLGKAISSYERSLVSANAPIDRYFAGDREAISISAQRGLTLFRTRARCAVCHSVNPSFPFFSDQNYRNTGVSTESAGFDLLARRATEAVRVTEPGKALENLAKEPAASELGRFMVTGNPLDIGSFRTPSLRNIELTAPYFHNGRAA
ncbi:MAG TPA: cytochrome c peroxidase, partial [Blastocatellia bacterium]|nr:cytochrome c peroxidase [Blastocatellia bacterium]